MELAQDPIGEKDLAKLTPDQVQSMLNALHATGLSARTVQYARAILRRALNQAMKWGHVTRNVAALTDAPRVEQHQVVPLSEQQARRLLEAVRGQRLEAVYRIALSLGLRRGEILGLHWADVDFERQTVRIAGALQRQNGKLQITPPKTKTGIRTLALPTVLVEVLRAHQAEQQEQRSILGEEWQEHGLVFPTHIGTPMEPRNLVHHFKTILQQAGLPETVRFHDLRHSCATLLIAQGVHPRVVMEILGHSQISVTMNTYGHVLSETQRDATDKIARLFETQADATEESDTDV